MENENPTILNPADLPSRRRQPKRNIPTLSSRGPSLLSSVAPTSYTTDPFSSTSIADINSDSDSDNDDGAVDRIDAQEIYGECTHTFIQFASISSFLYFC